MKLLLPSAIALFCLTTSCEAVVKSYNWVYEFASGESVVGAFRGEVGGDYDLYHHGYGWGVGDLSFITVLENVFFSLYLADGTLAGSVGADDGLLTPGDFAPQTVPKDGSREGLDIHFEQDTDGFHDMYFSSNAGQTSVELFRWTDDSYTEIESFAVSEAGNSGWRLLNPEIVPDLGTSTFVGVAFSIGLLGLARRFGDRS